MRQNFRCIKGSCVESDDPHLIQPFPETTGGGSQLHCDSAPCYSLGIADSASIIEKSLKCPRDCEDHDAQEVMRALKFKNSVSLRFTSCTNPLPVNSKPKCFLTKEGIFI